jgi:hypothetical protein
MMGLLRLDEGEGRVVSCRVEVQGGRQMREWDLHGPWTRVRAAILIKNVQIRSGVLQKPGRQSQLHVLDLKYGDGFVWET